MMPNGNRYAVQMFYMMHLLICGGFQFVVDRSCDIDLCVHPLQLMQVCTVNVGGSTGTWLFMYQVVDVLKLVHRNVSFFIHLILQLASSDECGLADDCYGSSWDCDSISLESSAGFSRGSRDAQQIVAGVCDRQCNRRCNCGVAVTGGSGADASW